MAIEDGPAAEREAVTSELGAIRHRGLANVDLNTNNQRPLELPELERMLERFDRADRRTRSLRLRSFLDAALAAYGEEHSREDERFVRRLFFTDKGGVPRGAGGPGTLLDSARDEHKLDADAFRKVQRQQFLDFASFLLMFARSHQAATSDAPAPVPHEDAAPLPSVRAVLGRKYVRACVIAVTALAVLLGGGLALKSNLHSGPSASGRGASTGSSQSQSTAPKFKFDSLASTVSNIVDVYPGVGVSAQDKRANGTFTNGDIVSAVCVTTGREVDSDPSAGESPRKSNQWVRINAVPGVVQYATLTYGDLIPGNAKLPSCAS